MEVLVIGPVPPCIRCQTVLRYAKECESQFNGQVEVRRIAADSEEAKKYGKAEGGHDIAKRHNVAHEHEKIEALMKEIHDSKDDDQKNETLIREKLQKIDTLLEPIKRKAVEEGYLMTPVLIVNGKVKSMDYIPEKDQIKRWIEEEINISGLG